MSDCCMGFGVDQSAIEDAEELASFTKYMRSCLCKAKSYAPPLRAVGQKINPIDVQRYGWPEKVPDNRYFGKGGDHRVHSQSMVR